MNEIAQGTMPLLHALAGIRFPALDWLLSRVTFFGEETLFMVVGLAVLWCWSKRGGYYLVTMGVIGTGVSQFLKLLFHVPRPWVLDSNFPIVESARGAANDWSFPSGHTQIAVGTYGGLALWAEKKWVKVCLWCLAALVAFSRLYLGVHTILDVGVAAVLALALALALRPVFRSGSAGAVRAVLLGTVALTGALIALRALIRYPADMSAEDAANLASGVRNLWLLLGASVGLWICFELDERVIRYDTKAVWWAQLLKLAGGLAIVLGMKTGLQKLFGRGDTATFFIYLAMILFACGVWPLTFKWFARLGRKETKV